MFIYKKCESSITKMTSVESIYINIYIYLRMHTMIHYRIFKTVYICIYKYSSGVRSSSNLVFPTLHGGSKDTQCLSLGGWYP